MLTLDILPSTCLMFARIILPTKTRPINLDQVAMSRSISRTTANRPIKEVSKSVPAGTLDGGGISEDSGMSRGEEEGEGRPWE